MPSGTRFFLRRPWKLPVALLARLPWFRFVRDTQDYQNPHGLGLWFQQKVFGIGGNRAAYWPVHWTSQVFDANRIYAGIDTCPGFSKGCYIQGRGGIWVGDYTQVAPNVVIVSANHDIYDLREDRPDPVHIGNYCWIGAGAKILPGVRLGDFTVVGTGAVVTKSFPEGHCVVGGNPATLIRELDRSKCVRHRCAIEYNGYIRKDRFHDFRRNSLEIDAIFNNE